MMRANDFHDTFLRMCASPLYEREPIMGRRFQAQSLSGVYDLFVL